jgi:hypothetical protein
LCRLQLPFFIGKEVFKRGDFMLKPVNNRFVHVVSMARAEEAVKAENCHCTLISICPQSRLLCGQTLHFLA